MREAGMKTIEPGMIADVIYEGDETKSQVPSLKTVIHAIKDRRIILSQTEPPITTALKGKQFLITFLERSDRRTSRYGVRARLIGVLADYQIVPAQPAPAQPAPAQPAPVLVMERESNLEIFDLRTAFRIRATQSDGVRVFFQGKEANIVNISIGGVCISESKELPLKPQEMVTVTVSIDGNKFDVESMVIRTWSSQLTCGPQHFASLQFLSHSTIRESLLGNKMMLLDRRRRTIKLD
jgi:hypothetical protein